MPLRRLGRCVAAQRANESASAVTVTKATKHVSNENVA